MNDCHCRYCGHVLSHTLIDLGEQPLANSYLSGPQAVAGERRFPLKVMVCGHCLLAQVTTDVPADAIFDAEYAYFSSYSASWVAHAKHYADVMIQRYALDPEHSFVMEAASNDGYLLQHFVARGYRVLGVEPAANCAEAARERGVPTDVAFFNAGTAASIVAQHGHAQLTAANNVLAHVPDIAGFVAGFREILAPEGVSTFEFPHLLNLIAKVQFDTIYHEHYSYLSLLAVERIFEEQGLRVIDVETLPTHGGSLRVHVARIDGTHADVPSSAVDFVRKAEADAGLGSLQGYAGFQARAEQLRDAFRSTLDGLRAGGKRVAAFGAAAKGNTFLNYCNIGTDDIAFAVDSNPAKQNRLLPGSHIPVLAPDAIAERRPDVVLILPWNLADEIASSHGYIRDWGGKFMVAVPKTRFF
jgi:SAM-dependent methyltransferase